MRNPVFPAVILAERFARLDFLKLADVKCAPALHYWLSALAGSRLCFRSGQWPRLEVLWPCLGKNAGDSLGQSHIPANAQSMSAQLRRWCSSAGRG